MNRQLRIPVIAGNWKMNMGKAQTAELIGALLPLIRAEGCRVILCPTFTSLSTAIELSAGSIIAVGAQNCHWEKTGAYTGEISANMLTELGVSHVIIGHSERRQYFGETDETVNRRINAALAAGLTPIVCVGELQKEREAGLTTQVCGRQIEKALSGLSSGEVGKLIVAYEPVWAIGTGLTATAEQANQAIREIRERIAELYSRALADTICILYGGSMNAANCIELLAQPEIDGGLIGGASLKAVDFAAIVAAAAI